MSSRASSRPTSGATRPTSASYSRPSSRSGPASTETVRPGSAAARPTSGGSNSRPGSRSGPISPEHVRQRSAGMRPTSGGSEGDRPGSGGSAGSPGDSRPGSALSTSSRPHSGGSGGGSRPGSAVSAASRSRRNRKSMESLPKLFPDDSEWVPTPRSFGSQDPDEDEPVCLGESVEMMEIVDEYIPEDSVPPSLENIIEAPPTPLRKFLQPPESVLESPQDEGADDRSWWFSAEGASREHTCFLLETLDVHEARMHDDGKAWVKVDSACRLFPKDFRKVGHMAKTTGTVAIENEWRLSVLDVDFDRNQIQLDVNECKRQSLVRGAMVLNLGVCPGWRFLRGKGGYNEAYESLCLAHHFSQVVIELGYGYLRFRAGPGSRPVYFCSYDGKLKLDGGASWTRRPSAGGAPEYHPSFFAPKVAASLERASPHEPYGGGDPLSPKGIRAGCWEGRTTGSGVFRLSNANCRYPSAALEADDEAQLRAMEEALLRIAVSTPAPRAPLVGRIHLQGARRASGLRPRKTFLQGDKAPQSGKATTYATRGTDGGWVVPISLILNDSGVALFRGKGDDCHEVSGDGHRSLDKAEACKWAVMFEERDERAHKWEQLRISSPDRVEPQRWLG